MTSGAEILAGKNASNCQKHTNTKKPTAPSKLPSMEKQNHSSILLFKLASSQAGLARAGPSDQTLAVKEAKLHAANRDHPSVPAIRSKLINSRMCRKQNS